ncbi:Phage tail fiber repeat protein [compost metagenome]
MYPPVVNSPKTELTELITETQTEITVANASVLLPGEGIAVLGNGDVAETITYTSVEENVLKGCVRGFEGVARAWPVGTRVARNFTAADFKAVQANIEELEGEVAAVSVTATAALPASQKGAANGVSTLGSDSKVPATQLPISTSTNSTSNTQVAAASAVKAAYDLALTKLDKGWGALPNDADMNSMTIIGDYQGIWNTPRTNEAITTTGPRRVVLNIRSVGANTYQRLSYIGGIGRGREFWRSLDGDWSAWGEVYSATGGDITGRMNVKIGSNPTQQEPAGNRASKILNFSDNPSEHGLAVGNRYGSPVSTAFLVGGTGGVSAFTEFFKVDGVGTIWFRDADGSMVTLQSIKAAILSGNGSPEGAVSASVGTLFRRLDGGANTTLYVKQSGAGNTGWRAV